MTDGKMIAILEELRDDRIANMSNSNIVGEAEALSMAVEMLAKGIDLATENEQLKAKLDDAYAKCNAIAAESVKYKDAAIDEARCSANLRAEVRTLKECITLICREVCR